jgi:chromosome segregation ATPase
MKLIDTLGRWVGRWVAAFGILGLVLVGPRALAQDIDDIEADVDTAISESEAVQKEVEANRIRLAREKRRLRDAQIKAEKTKVLVAAKEVESHREIQRLDLELKKNQAARAVKMSEIKALNAKIVELEKKVATAKAQKERSDVDLEAALDVLKSERRRQQDLLAELQKVQNDVALRQKKLKNVSARLKSVKNSNARLEKKRDVASEKR